MFILNRSNLSELGTSTSRVFAGLQYLMNSRFVNSISNSISNISAHYDISNQMFSAFLSKDMTYSCAIFGEEEGGLDGDLPVRRQTNNLVYDLQNSVNRASSTSSSSSSATGATTPEASPKDDVDQLEQAQLRKLHTIIDRARLSKGDRVLEIGSGWGSFAMEAVKRCGCTVDTLTLSVEPLLPLRGTRRHASGANNISSCSVSYTPLG